MLLTINALVMLVGLLIYMLSNNPANNKLAEVGRIMFAFGLLALLLSGAQIVALLK